MTTFFLGGDRGPAALSGAAMEAWQQALPPPLRAAQGGEERPMGSWEWLGMGKNGW